MKCCSFIRQRSGGDEPVPATRVADRNPLHHTDFADGGGDAYCQSVVEYPTKSSVYLGFKTITYEMRRKMIEKLGRIRIRQYETRGSGGINAHLITDIETIDQNIGSTLSKF